MLTANRQGFHTSLTNEIFDEIISAVDHVIVPSQIAAYVGINRKTFYNWLERGKKDAENEINSVFAQLLHEIQRAQSKIAKEILSKLRDAPRNHQSLTWILEKCFREDFGADNEEIKELRNLFTKILPMISKGDANATSVDSSEG